MPEAIIITPVKDSPETTRETVKAVAESLGDFEYFVFNDFSGPETTQFLENTQKTLGFHLVHLADITSTPSPNYRIVLQKAQELALQKNCHLIIVESDVVVRPDTFSRLLAILQQKPKPGLVGAITVDRSGNYNFPYTFEKTKSNEVVNTAHSLSFCCTLLSNEFLKVFDFRELADNKDWFDVYISRQSKKMGFNNYLDKGNEVLHLPHSSRPWKLLKYKNPFLYYLRKIFYNRDRI